MDPGRQLRLDIMEGNLRAGVQCIVGTRMTSEAHASSSESLVCSLTIEKLHALVSPGSHTVSPVHMI